METGIGHRWATVRGRVIDELNGRDEEITSSFLGDVTTQSGMDEDLKERRSEEGSRGLDGPLLSHPAWTRRSMDTSRFAVRS